jgi:hypothetical protein
MDDEELGPFATLYEEWTGSYPEALDPAIEERLAEMYRSAWASGDWLERLYILYFVMKRESYQQDRDLILEGLASEDFRVAHTASPLAGVAIRLKGVDLGPELVEIYRAAALRHPILDIHRDPKLRRPGDGWPEGRPFIQLYEEWMSNHPPRDSALEGRLANITQATWDGGDAVDKAYVLRFLWCHRERRVDFVLEGASSEDCGLAYLALFEAETMLRDGYDLGPEIFRLAEQRQKKCGDTFLVLVNGIRMELEDRDERTRAGGSIQGP